MKFEIDGVQYVVKGPDEAEELPWRFEIVNEDQLSDQIETWLNNVNEDFGGKLNEDPPSEFFEIISSQH